MSDQLTQEELGRYQPCERANDGSIHVDQTILHSTNLDDALAMVRVEIWPVEPDDAKELMNLLGEAARKWMDEKVGTSEAGWQRHEVDLN